MEPFSILRPLDRYRAGGQPQGPKSNRLIPKSKGNRLSRALPCKVPNNSDLSTAPLVCIVDDDSSMARPDSSFALLVSGLKPFFLLSSF
jgi:hypothetical protein